MKLLVKIAFLFSIPVMLFTGCVSTGTKTPEKLLTRPNYDEEKAILSSGIIKVISQNVNLIFPSNSKETGKINYVDLDEDGVNEVVAFQKKETPGKETQVGFIVLRDNGDSYNFLQSGEVLETGKKIEYAGFYDLDSDGKKEIIMQYRDISNKSNIGIYSLEENEIVKKYFENRKDEYDKIGDKDILMKIGYIDEDNIYDIIILSYDSPRKKMNLSVYDIKEGALRLKDRISYDNQRGLSETKLYIGNVSKQKKGIVLDYPTDTSQGMTTSVLYLKNDKLIKLSSDSDIKMYTSYYMPITDINSDNVIDIPCISSASTLDKSYATVDYYQYMDEINDFVKINEIYYNYSYNFRITIPQELWGAVKIDQSYKNEDIIFTFSSYENGRYNSIFVLSVKPKSSKIEDNKSLNKEKTTVTVMDSEEYSYQVSIKDVNLATKYGFNTKNIRNIFARAYE